MSLLTWLGRSTSLATLRTDQAVPHGTVQHRTQQGQGLVHAPGAEAFPLDVADPPPAGQQISHELVQVSLGEFLEMDMTEAIIDELGDCPRSCARCLGGGSSDRRATS